LLSQVAVLGWSTASTAATAPLVGKLKFLHYKKGHLLCLGRPLRDNKFIMFVVFCLMTAVARLELPSQVAVLGWSTASTAATAPSVGKLKFLPETAAVQRCLAELRAQHRDLDYVIGLSHAGM
jgi:hypothetical protein